MVYLFLGQDCLSKDEQLGKIKQEFLTRDLQQFNQDILYGAQADLKDLQEAFLRLPAPGARQRLVVIKEPQELDEKARNYVLNYAAKPLPEIILVLDINQPDRKDEFINRLCRLSRVFRFKQIELPDTFALSRQISAGSSSSALKILDRLLKNGERPERILGGLRYAWERETMSAVESSRRLKCLVRADLEIKTGRLRPVFALEKLVISLCAAVKPPAQA